MILFRYIKFHLRCYIPYMALALPWRFYPPSWKQKTLQWRMRLTEKARAMRREETRRRLEKHPVEPLPEELADR